MDTVNLVDDAARTGLAQHLLFAEMATVAAVVAKESGDLPDFANITVATEIIGTHPYRFRPVIAVQLDGWAGVDEVGAWATRFESPVRLIRREGYVEVSTEMTRSGHTVVVWTHITHADADVLAQRLGRSLVTVLDIESLNSQPGTLPCPEGMDK